MFNKIEEIIEDIKNGRMVIVLDDEARENEGDLLMAASFAMPEDINFMAKYGRGLICVALEPCRLDELELHPMIKQNRDPHGTDWAISVDAKAGITTGISAHDRAQTIKLLIGPHTKPEDLVRPGHVFPLRAKEGGVLVRAGHTEASVDLARLAGLYPAGVICEIMNDDGTMARTSQLVEFAKIHQLKLCTVRDLIEYRRKREKLVERVTETVVPTDYGDFTLILYESRIDKLHHLALVMGDVGSEKFKAKSEKLKIDSQNEGVLVRVHSECLTGDVFTSKRCDCGAQLREAMAIIQREGRGVILYMRQEGRGIGLVNKLKAYALQDRGLDTVEANEALGFEPDLRDYGVGAQMLVDLGVTKIRLLTNNPKKVVGLEGYGLEIIERLALEIIPHPANREYLRTKKEKLGHKLNSIE